MSNYGPMHLPSLVKAVGKGAERGTEDWIAENSAAVYLGSFVSMITALTPATGATNSLQTFADDNRVYGYVVGFHKKDSNLPIWEESSYSGTVTNATGELPVLYTFASTNSDSGGPAEMITVVPVTPDDILEVALWGASAISVARGTTTGSGTPGYAMSINTTYAFSLLESTSSTTFTNLDAIVVAIRGRQPRNSHHAYVKFQRTQSSAVFAD